MATDSTYRFGPRVTLILIMIAVGAVSLWFQPIPKGLDLLGGTELRYKIRYEDIRPEDRADLTDKTISAIRRRIDPGGTSEIDIRKRGQFRFYVQLPKMSPEDAQRVETRMQQMGKLQFCLVSDDPELRQRARQGRSVHDSGGVLLVPYIKEPPRKGEAVEARGHFLRSTYRELARLQPPDGDWLLVAGKPEVTGDDLDTRSIGPTTDQRGFPAVGFAFKGRGRLLFARTTERHKGERLAIILDNVLYSAPVIQERIGDRGVINGNFTANEQRDLIITLQSGQLPADIELEWKHAVGAKLGEDSIRAGIRASFIGLLIVAAFIGVYYLGIGLVANVALLVNMLLILGCLSLLHAVMTLPGIAGLILTMGMAVDANVLIYERIREERALGKSARLAMKNGFSRAMTTIVDSNLTTLITAIILFLIGTGPVRGFATVLSIGIISSMFCALTVTRVIMELMLSRNMLKTFHMLTLFARQPRIDFCRMRYAAIGGSILAIVFGLAVFRWRGEDKYDNDLTGGFMAQMELAGEMSVDAFRNRVRDSGYPDADIQSVAGTAEERRTASATSFTIRVKQPPLARRQAKVQTDLEAMLKEHNLFGQVELIPSLDPNETHLYRLTLTQDVAEADVRRFLQDAGYRDSDIVSLAFENVPARNYRLALIAGDLDPAGMEKLPGRISKALGDLIVVRTSRFQADLPQRDEEMRGANAAARYYVDLTFDTAMPRAAIQDAIVRQILEKKPEDVDIEVQGTGSDSGADVVRSVRVRSGRQDLLRAIANGATQPLAVSSFLQHDTSIDIECKEAVLESALRDRLRAAGLLDYVRAIVAQEARGKVLIAHLGMVREEGGRREIVLRDAKVLEMIEADLKNAFAEEVARTRVEVAFETTEAPAFLVDVGIQVQPDDHFVRMSLGQPMTVQVIQSNLERAGFGTALVLEENINAVATEVRSEAVLRLRGDAAAVSAAEQRMREEFSTPHPFQSLESIGPTVAGETKNQAIAAVLLSLVAIIIYVWFRFGELKFGIGGVVALAHDVLMTMGAVAVADWLSDTTIGQFLGFSNIKINMQMIAAFLTIVGYSINDTIVVYDRIRENLGGGHKRVSPELINNSINQTLSRTVLTAFTTLEVCVALYLLGGPVIHGFAFAMSFGIIVGTYSSIFIASPIVLEWDTVTGFIFRRRRPAAAKGR